MKIAVFAALLLLAAPVCAQTPANNNPSVNVAPTNPGLGTSGNASLDEAKAKMHKHVERLDTLSEAQWEQLKKKHPGKHANLTLAQAREMAHKKEQKLDSMTPEQYAAHAKDKGKRDKSSLVFGNPGAPL